MTSIETTGGLYRAETKIITGGLVSNNLHSRKTVQMAVKLAYEGDVFCYLYILLEATSAHGVVIL
jgi:hypothetical protein